MVLKYNLNKLPTLSSRLKIKNVINFYLNNKAQYIMGNRDVEIGNSQSEFNLCVCVSVCVCIRWHR